MRGRTEAKAIRHQRRVKETGLPYHVDYHGYPRTIAPVGYQTTARIENGTIRLHNLVMEEHLDRPIQKGEVIHHIDFDKMNCKIENLYLCKSNSEHFLIHGSLGKVVKELLGAGVIFFKPGYGYCLVGKSEEESPTSSPKDVEIKMKRCLP